MSFQSASILRVIQYIPVGLVFVPATAVAYIGIPQNKSNSVAGLVNFMRNIGQSFGTSAVTTILAQRSQFHQTRLVDHTAVGDVNFQNMLSGTTQAARSMAGNGHADASRIGLAQVYQTVQTQASSLSYLDVFYMLMVISAVMFFLSFLLQANKPKKQVVAAH
jgi:MFS transporter, DHA2 family, multidrug resistance protein